MITTRWPIFVTTSVCLYFTCQYYAYCMIFCGYCCVIRICDIFNLLLRQCLQLLVVIALQLTRVEWLAFSWLRHTAGCWAAVLLTSVSQVSLLRLVSGCQATCSLPPVHACCILLSAFQLYHYVIVHFADYDVSMDSLSLTYIVLRYPDVAGKQRLGGSHRCLKQYFILLTVNIYNLTTQNIITSLTIIHKRHS